MVKKDFQKYLQKVGLRIKELRNNRYLTQLDLEKLTGISRNDISKIENGLKNVELFTLYKVAKGLDVPIHWMLQFPPGD